MRSAGRSELPPNRADCVLLTFVTSVWPTVVALGRVGDNRIALAQQTCGATLDEWRVGQYTHGVDVLARFNIVKSVEYDVEGLEEEYIKFGIHDVGMFSIDINVFCKLFHLYTETRTQIKLLSQLQWLWADQCARFGTRTDDLDWTSR